MANALYRPSVDNAVYQTFGMQPNMDRLNLLPRHDPKLGWIAPNALYQMARAFVSPGVAAQGGYVSPEDAVNFGGMVGSGGFGASAAMRNAALGPGKTVGMYVTPTDSAKRAVARSAVSDVLYHGTNAAFDRFELRPSIKADQSALGIFMVKDPGGAAYYARGQGGNVRPVVADIRTPYVVKDRWDPIWQKATNSAKDARIVREDLVSKGYDGMFTPDQEIVAFDPSRVFSAWEK